MAHSSAHHNTERCKPSLTQQVCHNFLSMPCASLLKFMLCNENAEFKGGECNGNYTGDGISCTRESDLPDRRVAVIEHR